MHSRASDTSAQDEPFRPFFVVDERFRIRGWPEVTARALHRPARMAIGRFCWEVTSTAPAPRPGERCQCCAALQSPADGAGSEASPAAAPDGCAVLPLPGPTRRAIIWLPLSRIATGAAGSTQMEGLVIRGALAGRLDSIEGTLDGLRRACAADDCELFLLDASGREVFLVDCEGPDRDAFLQQTRMPLGAGYPGKVTQSQKPLFTNRFQHDRLFLRDAVKRRGIRSFLGVPLLHAGRPLGYVGLGWRNASVPMEWGTKVLEDVKSLIAVALRGRYLPARTAEAPAARLVIRCFGPFEVLQNGHKIPPEAFRRRRALELLKILILQRGVPVHRDQLVEQLWPGAAAGSGANRLHGVVSALRSTIEAGRSKRSSHYIVCREDHYLFNTAAPQSVDLHDFLELIAAARSAQRQGAEDHALTLFEDAMGLYRGDLFADDTGNESFEMHRVQLRHSYLDAVRAVTAARVRRNQIDEAARVLRAALALEPVAVDLQELLIGQLARVGRIVEARQQYESCRVALRRYLDMEPPPKIRALEKLLY
jgi:DNA-binding SARP family transcriptional activator